MGLNDARKGVEFLNYHGYRNCVDYPTGLVLEGLFSLVRWNLLGEVVDEGDCAGRRVFVLVSNRDRRLFYESCAGEIGLRESINIFVPEEGSAKEILTDYSSILDLIRKRVHGGRQRRMVFI